MNAFMQTIRKSIKSKLPDYWVKVYARINVGIIKWRLINRCSTIKTRDIRDGPLYCVTLTSYGSRINDTAPYAIASILNQEVLPDKLVLWLAHGSKIPQVYDKLISCGLEIKYCDDIKSYKKLIPALLTYPNDVLITADDDVIYPHDWLNRLILANKKDPMCILGFRCHGITMTDQLEVRPYSEWKKCINKDDCVSEFSILPTGVNGILYPPKSLDKRCLSRDLFMRIAPSGDDIWFWAMGRLNGTKYKIVQHELQNFDPVDPSEKGLFEEVNSKEGNDIQFKNLMNEYPELLDKLRKEYRRNV